MPKDESILPRVQVLCAQVVCEQLLADVARVDAHIKEELPEIEEALLMRLRMSFIGTQMFWNALFETCDPKNNDDVRAIIAKGYRAIHLYKKCVSATAAQKVPDGVFRIIAERVWVEEKEALSAPIQERVLNFKNHVA